MYSDASIPAESFSSLEKSKLRLYSEYFQTECLSKNRPADAVSTMMCFPLVHHDGRAAVLHKVETSRDCCSRGHRLVHGVCQLLCSISVCAGHGQADPLFEEPEVQVRVLSLQNLQIVVTFSGAP